MQNPWYKYNVNYKWMKTKGESTQEYDLDSVKERRLYYNQKVGKEIEFLREYFETQTLLAYWMAPKQAGKGTYMSALKEIFGQEMFVHLSVGDLVRKAHIEYDKDEKLSEIYAYAKGSYRGDMHLDEAFDALSGRSTTSLIPTELVMIILRRAIDKAERKTLFIDGFPRSLDQVSYALYFRELINYRHDPDIFIMINAPLTVLDDRMKERRTCMKCGNSRNMVLLPTENVEYNKDTDSYHLICDQPDCDGGRMVTKEGDHLGISALKSRFLVDIEVMKRARKLYGIPKIELFNSLEKEKTFDYVDEYECTPSCTYSHNKNGKVTVGKELWTLNDGGELYNSLLPAAVVTQLVKQLANVLGYKE